ncbi:hypothetical protein Vafri_17424, partial [Volvox africanus]
TSFNDSQKYYLKPLKVLVAHRPPFVFWNETSGEHNGLLIDIFLEIIAHKSINNSFDFIFTSTNDDAGGIPVNGTWTGVTGKLFNGNADVALFPLTRTADCLSVIDCTYPYLDEGLSLLVQAPRNSTQDPGPLSVLAPFSLT